MSATHQAIVERLKVKNYRSLVDVDVALGPLTVFVGRNSAGKSNTVDVLRFVRDALTLGLDQALLNRHGISNVRSFFPDESTDGDIEIGLSLRGEDWSAQYAFAIGSEKADEYDVKWETATVEDHVNNTAVVYKARNGKIVEMPDRSNKHDLPFADEDLPGGRGLTVSTKALALPTWAFWTFALWRVSEFLRNMSFYSIYPDNLRMPQYPASPEVLDEQARNLASVLRRLKQQGYDDFSSSLTEALSRIVDEVYGYTVEQVGGLLATKLHHSTSGNGDESGGFYLANESDGTLRVLGILTALYQSPPRALLAIEEPELNIHPGALEVLCDVLREASLRSQVLITTHSPDLITNFHPDVLRVVEKINGATKIDRISEKQHRAILENLFSPGDLMRIEGLSREHSGVE